MKNFKKVVALSLAFLMVIAAVVVSPVTAKAEGATSGNLENLNGGLDAGKINLLAHPYAPQINWQDAATWAWCEGMILEYQAATATWKVVEIWTVQMAQDMVNAGEAPRNAILDTEFGVNDETGLKQMAVIWHDSAADQASMNFFRENNVLGKEFYLVGDFSKLTEVTKDAQGNDVLASGALTGVSLTTVEPEDYYGKDTLTPDAGTTTPDAGTTTPDAGTTTPDAGTTTPDAGTSADKEQIKNTGDNFMPMMIVLFAGVAMITVATIAKRKRA